MSSIRGPLAPIQICGSRPSIGFGVQSGVVQRVEPPLEIDRAVAVPEQPDHRQRLLETADRSREVEAVGHGVLALAAAQAEDEAALGEVVDGQRRLGQHGGMAAHGVDDGADKRNLLGQHRGRGRYRQPVQVTVRRR